MTKKQKEKKIQSKTLNDELIDNTFYFDNLKYGKTQVQVGKNLLVQVKIHEKYQSELF